MFSRDLRRPLARAFLSVPALALFTTGLAAPVADGRARIVDRVTTVAGVARPGLVKTITAREFEMIGLDWEGAHDAAFEVRARRGRGWGPWYEVEGHPAEGPTPGSREHRAHTSAGPLWLGRQATSAQVRMTKGAAPRLRIHALHVVAPAQSRWRAVPARADPGPPGITSRAAWGADERWKPCAVDQAPAVRFAVLHHTVTPNDYKPEDVPRLLQGIYHFHTKVNRWCDLGYNVLIDRFGRVFEGRSGGLERTAIGAHAAGFNTGSVGVGLLGDFTKTPVPEPMKFAIRTYLDWKLALHLIDPRSRPVVVPEPGSKHPAGKPLAVDAVTTHRDLNSTVCPGGMLDAGLVERIRQEVQADIINHAPEPLAGWRPANGGQPVLVLDRLGGLHPGGGQASVKHGAFWPRWPIARGAVRDGAGGYVVNAFGGVHAFGGAPKVKGSAYWRGSDLARGIARGPHPGSGWVLDAHGGLHPYGGAPMVLNGPAWPGFDIARGVATNGTRTGGYVLDGWGGVHPFGTARRVAYTGYSMGRDIARAIAVRPDGASGWVLDGFGGLHPFGGAPRTRGPYWPGWDIARGLTLNAAGTGGWIVDGWGGIHAFGDAKPVAPSMTWTHLDAATAVL